MRYFTFYSGGDQLTSVMFVKQCNKLFWKGNWILVMIYKKFSDCGSESASRCLFPGQLQFFSSGIEVDTNFQFS